MTNFKYPAISAIYQEAYGTFKPIETVTKFRSFDPKTEWYRNYLKRKVTRLLQVITPLRLEYRAYIAKLNQTNSEIEKEVYQARNRRSTASIVDFLKEVLKTFMGVF